MTQKGSHTWDLIVQYHRCPSCGLIIESRQDYQFKDRKKTKKLICSRCQNEFTVTKPVQQWWAPLFGSQEPIEMDWESREKF